MMKNIFAGVLMIVLVACAAPQTGTSDAPGSDAAEVEVEAIEVPPEGSLPLSEIVASIEVANHITITEVEFEGGVWEVEFVVGDERYQLEIDPLTGESLSDEPVKAEDD